MSRNRFTFGFILVALSVALSASTQSAENGCISCHQQSDFYVQYPKLHDYYQQFLVSPHNQAGVTCDSCHGGDASANSLEKAHVGVLPMSNKDSTVHYQEQPETCGQCHSDKRAQFVQSKHYAALMGQRSAPTCTTCHPAMSSRPEYRIIVLNACRNCHGEGNSENLPLIADRAENVFNQLNIAGGFLGWTKIHYESSGWPEGSQKRVQDLDMRYRATLNQVHQFDLQQTEDQAEEILVELTEIFNAARAAHDQQVQ